MSAGRQTYNESSCIL
jgi:hypothetical protein